MNREDSAGQTVTETDGGVALNPVTKQRDTTAKKVARFGLLVALSLVLGLMDRAIPLTWFLSGAIPGIKLGLANTVLVYAVYLMDWRSCFLLMLAKVVLSGLIFGSLSAILYSLSGGLLSLLVMLLVRRYPKAGSLCISCWPRPASRCC